MSFIRRGIPREHPFSEEKPMMSCKRCGSATGGIVECLCASCDGRIRDSIAGRPRTTTLRGAPPPAHLPAEPLNEDTDEDTIVVDPLSPCEMLVAFADGELDAAAAQAMREHLASCSACERDLTMHLQLGAALSTLRPR